MTPAEFKTLREHLQLTTRWLAERWGVSEVSVQRWERNRDAPESLQQELLEMQVDAQRLIEAGISREYGTIEIPRTDAESLGEYPAAFYRMCAQAISKETGAMIVYRPKPLDFGYRVEINPSGDEDFEGIPKYAHGTVMDADWAPNGTGEILYTVAFDPPNDYRARVPGKYLRKLKESSREVDHGNDAE